MIYVIIEKKSCCRRLINFEEVVSAVESHVRDQIKRTH